MILLNTERALSIFDCINRKFSLNELKFKGVYEGQMSVADQIAQLKSLQESGALSQAEFLAQKESILAGAPINPVHVGQSKTNKTMSVEAKTTLVFALVPFILVLIAFTIAVVRGKGGIDVYETWNVMSVLGPLGPNYLVMFFVRAPNAIFHLIAAFDLFYFQPLIIGIAHLAALYYLMRNEGKFSKNHRIAAMLSILAYGFIAFAVVIFWQRDEVFGIISVPVTLIALLIVRASFGAFSKKNA